MQSLLASSQALLRCVDQQTALGRGLLLTAVPGLRRINFTDATVHFGLCCPSRVSMLVRVPLCWLRQARSLRSPWRSASTPGRARLARPRPSHDVAQPRCLLPLPPPPPLQAGQCPHNSKIICELGCGSGAAAGACPCELPPSCACSGRAGGWAQCCWPPGASSRAAARCVA